MRMRRAAIAMLALAGLLCFSGGAWAKARHGGPPAMWIDIELEGSNGYSIHISVNQRQRLLLQVTKEGYAAEYMARDVLAETDRVKAKLLGLGTISVRFHPRGPVRHPSVFGCGSKKPPTVQPGVVRGTIRFAGEREYTQVKVHEAEAATEKPTSRCRYGAKFESNFRDREWVSKFSAEDVGALFLARKYRPGTIGGGQVLYWAETAVRYETASGRVPLVVYRHVRVPAPASTFSDPHPGYLTVSPPPPLSGTGTFARTPESVFTWEGDLSVQFPGLDPIPLAGPSFGSEYCLRKLGCVRQSADPG